MEQHKKIAYFCMEFGIEDAIKTYAGGLGILAGDTIKAATDAGVDFTGITLLYKKGYFKQEIGEHGEQLETEDEWDYTKYLQNTEKKFSFSLGDKEVWVEVLRYDITSMDGTHTNTVYFLNADIPENNNDYNFVSYNLYTPVESTRLHQELVLGIGGVKALQELGLEEYSTFHLNESHAAFGVLALEEQFGSREAAKQRIIFTTHTPAEHGHKKYQKAQLESELGEHYMQMLSNDFEDGELHLTKFSLRNARKSNAVSQRHGEVSRNMFPECNIDAITNGIHTYTWSGNATKSLFDEYMPTWRHDPIHLHIATQVPDEFVRKMHAENKRELLELIEDKTDKKFSGDIFTIGFGRRVDTYKRSGFIFHNLPVLKHIANKFGGLQIVMAGKAYFNYEPAEKKIFEIVELSDQDLGALRVVYLLDYGMDISQKMIQGCDLWLNNPIKPLEASGTSGMKAALNGVPSFSTIDGWWVEGWDEGITGWAIGTEAETNIDEEVESYQIYSKLEYEILPTYHFNKAHWTNIQKQCIAKNATGFSARRMVQEYLERMW